MGDLRNLFRVSIEDDTENFGGYCGLVECLGLGRIFEWLAAVYPSGSCTAVSAVQTIILWRIEIMRSCDRMGHHERNAHAWGNTTLSSR